MQKQNVPAHVQEWLTEAEQNAVGDIDRMAELCDKLDQYAEENDDTSIKGQSLFYRGFNQYANAKLEEGMELLSLSINYLISANLWRLTANAYNSMANIADFQGDVSMAIDYYLKGLYIATEHDIQKLEYAIRTGISNIYIGLGSYESAIAMLLECEHLQKCGANIPLDPLLVATANMVSCYTHLGDADKAAKKLDELRAAYSEHPSAINSLLLCILESQFYHLTGNNEALDTAIATLNNLELDDMDIFDASHELILHAQLLLDLEKLEELDLLLTRLEALIDSPTIEQKILDLRMMYFHKIGNYNGLAEKALRFHEVSKQCEAERSKTANHNILTRMRLDEETRKRQDVEKANLLLRQKSEHDALTGLNNRYRLNEIAELAFHTAQRSGSPLTVEILDIDCYKEFNDNYGHQTGDECLVRIANAIRSLEEFRGVHTARYGGDEFVVIYEGYSLQEVEKLAQLRQSRIYDLNLEHKFSSVSDRVSISQGLFHHVPAADNTIWDFLHCADIVLYGVKKRGKNSYHMETSFAGATQYRETAPE